MASKITVFVNRYSGKNPIASGCILSFCNGLKHLGVNFSVAYEDQYDKNPCDIAVIFGAYKKILKTYNIRKKIFFNQKIAGKKVLVLERGFIKREDFHSVGWNFINGRADFKNKNMPGDRVSRLNVELSDWKTNGEDIVFCAQVPWDVSVQHINQEPIKRVSQKDLVKGYLNWCTDTIKNIQKVTDRKIIFRPHPLFPYKNWHLDNMPDNVTISSSSFDNDLDNAWCTVVFNSNCSVESAIKGIPTFAFDEGCMAWDIANKNINNIESPDLPDRVQWLNNISYSQWNLEEFSKGLPWIHITRSA